MPSKRSRLTPKFNVESSLKPSEIQVGGHATHTVTVVNESKVPCRYEVVLETEEPDVVHYVGRRADGTVVHSVRFGLSLDVERKFESRLFHVEQEDSCANLPHFASVEIYWGDKTGLPTSYEDPEMEPGLNFDCLRRR